LIRIDFFYFILIPILILNLGMISMGAGIIISSMTHKYKDLNMLVGIGLTLIMYATPIMYPSSSIPEFYKPFLSLNPISPLIESFRYITTGHGLFSINDLLYSFLFGVFVVAIGVVVFNKTEKTFMDTV